MRIAYIILAHRLIEQVARLIRVLSAPDDTFFVHIDKKADHQAGVNLLSTLMSSVGPDADVRPVKRHSCFWGNWSLIGATLEAMQAVIDSEIQYERVVLLSGQDYPIKSRAYIKDFFVHHREAEFVESFSLATKNRWTEWGGQYSDISRAWHLHLSVRSHWLHIPIRRKIPLGWVPHGGSQWWCLTRPAVEYILQLLSSHPEVSRYFRRSFIPDEMFFQTVLANSPYASRVTGDNLTYVDSSSPTPPWPTVLDTTFYPTLMASPKLFARKFDVGHDAAILDLLDQAILPECTEYTGTAQSRQAPSHQWA